MTVLYQMGNHILDSSHIPTSCVQFNVYVCVCVCLSYQKYA